MNRLVRPGMKCICIIQPSLVTPSKVTCALLTSPPVRILHSYTGAGTGGLAEIFQTNNGRCGESGDALLQIFVST